MSPKTKHPANWLEELAVPRLRRRPGDGESSLSADRGDPRPVAYFWAVASAALAPSVLIAAWVIADLVQPPSYNPMRQTVSVLAGQAGVDPWIMTWAFVAIGGFYFVTAAGLGGLAWPARLLLVLSGLCSLGIAATPEPATGPTVTHLAWTAVGAVTATLWPAVASWRPADRRASVSWPWSGVVTTIFVVLLAWVVLETFGGNRLGLAERLASAVQCSWPFVVAVTLWRANHRYRQTTSADRRE